MPDDDLRHDAPLHERDFALWAEAQARALAEGRADALDWGALAEEIDSLGRAQKNEIRSRLAVLLHHLLKWEHQPEARKYGWRATIIEQRAAIAAVIEDSPSLAAFPALAFDRAYASARRQAALETGLDEAAFPETCAYPLDAVLDGAFYPGPSGS